MTTVSSDDVEEIEPEPGMPCLSVELKESPEQEVKAGEKIEYTVTVTNTGNVTVFDLEIVDFPVTRMTVNEVNLIPGESTTITCTYTATWKDAVNEILEYSVRVNGRDLIDRCVEGEGENCLRVFMLGSILNGFVLPEDAVTVETEAFAGTCVQSVILPEGCKSVGSAAFADCPNLLLAILPGTVISIAPDAFNGSPVTVSCPTGSYAALWCATNDVPFIEE